MANERNTEREEPQRMSTDEERIRDTADQEDDFDAEEDIDEDEMEGDDETV
jgi:hypothetical protein